MINVEQTIISQYGTSPVLRGIIDNINECVDPSADIDGFYSFVWNVDTAHGFGLDIWGKIVNISRYLTIVSAEVQFGFQEGYPDYGTFGEAPFRATSGGLNVYSLSDDAYRLLILTKALANISNCTVPSLNRILTLLFGHRGKCYVLISRLKIQYTFEFRLTPIESAIIEQSGALPKPAGVEISAVQII